MIDKVKYFQCSCRHELYRPVRDDKILVKKDIQSELSKELFAALKGTLIPVQRVPVERINRITRKIIRVVAFISPLLPEDEDLALSL